MLRILLAVLLLVCAVPVEAQITEETVGDPDSFGRARTYLGLAQARVTLRPDCTGFPPDADPCIETAPPPTVTSVDETDLDTIVLPGKATNSLVCFTFTPLATWQWENLTATPQPGRMFLRPSVRVESTVLEDPSLLDPDGMPFNGVLFESTITTYLETRTVAPGETELQYRGMTRSCIGGLLSERVLRDGYGLSDAVIKEFFKNPITFTFGVTGDVAAVSTANYIVGVRLYGD